MWANGLTDISIIGRDAQLRTYLNDKRTTNIQFLRIFVLISHMLHLGLIESNTTWREGRGNPFRLSKICNPRRGLLSRGCCKSKTREWDSRVPPSMWCLVIFFHSWLKMCEIWLKRTLDATFLDCLALTFCDVIGELLPEWVRLTLQGGTTFLLTSKLADIPVSRVRIVCVLALRPVSSKLIIFQILEFRTSLGTSVLLCVNNFYHVNKIME